MSERWSVLPVMHYSPVDAEDGAKGVEGGTSVEATGGVSTVGEEELPKEEKDE